MTTLPTTPGPYWFKEASNPWVPCKVYERYGLPSGIVVEIDGTIFPVSKLSHGEFRPALNPDQVADVVEVNCATYATADTDELRDQAVHIAKNRHPGCRVNNV